MFKWKGNKLFKVVKWVQRHGSLWAKEENGWFKFIDIKDVISYWKIITIDKYIEK